MSLEILRNRSAKSKLTRAFETCQERRAGNHLRRPGVSGLGTFFLFWRAGLSYSVFQRALRRGSSSGPAQRRKGICKPQFSVRNATCRKRSASATAIAATARRCIISASAWTANTTARIAGKRAKLAWRNRIPNTMAEDPVRVVFHLDQKWNLVTVFCCAVEHQAIHAGFETEAGAQLASAAGDVCRESISQLSGNGSGVDVTLETYSDRIEIAIH